MLMRWMLAAALFSACLGVAAHGLERVQRARGAVAGRWGTRGGWTLALVGAVLWPAAVPLWQRWRGVSSAVDAPTLAVPGALRATVIDAAEVSTHDWTAWLAAARATLAEWRAQVAQWPDRVDDALLAADAAGLSLGLALLWLACSLLLALRLVRGVRALQAVTSHAESTRVDGEPVLLAEGFGPATVGWRTPRIVLPSWVRDLEAPLRALVLAHERAHRDARDPQLAWLATLAVVLVPWNPGVWWIARRLRLAVELDCDARTLAAVPPAVTPQHYARLLLFMAHHVGRSASVSSSRMTSLASAMASSRSHLQARIRTMHTHRIDPTSRAARRQRVLFGSVVLLAVAAACGTSIPGNVTSAPSRSPADVALGDAPSASPEAAPVPMPNGFRDTVPLGVPDTITSTPYFEYQVERPAALRGAMALRYPPVLRTAGVEGEVLASFVVQEDGRVDTSTFRVLGSDHPLFTDAVRTAVVNATYDAAEVGGRRVRQLVQQPFVFALGSSALERARQGSSAVMLPSPRDDVSAPRTPGGEAPPAASDARRTPAQPASDVFFEYQVQTPAAMRGSGGIMYPPLLRAARVEGTVLASFVVDEEGLIEMRTFKVLKSDHDAFTDAVRDALPAMRFQAAEVDGRRVKQLVQQPFVFNLAR